MKKNEQDILVPIICAACGFCLITAIFVYYCKVVRKNNETEEKQENPVHDACDYAGDNYAKEENFFYADATYSEEKKNYIEDRNTYYT